jgi:hypothetical protein
MIYSKIHMKDSCFIHAILHIQHIDNQLCYIWMIVRNNILHMHHIVNQQYTYEGMKAILHM